MDRRHFIKLAALAAGALGLGARAEAQPEATNAITKPDMAHSTNYWPKPPMPAFGDIIIIDDTGDYRPLSRDSRMFREFARLEFRQRELWPRNARITNIAAPGEIDAL